MAMTEVSIRHLLQTDTLSVRDVDCRGTCRHKSAAECALTTSLVFAYRGIFVRHVGREDAVAEVNQVVFFNAGEEYCISHPLAGGDRCLSISISDPFLDEIAPKSCVRDGPAFAFRRQRLRIDARAQAVVAILRHGLVRTLAEPLEAETLALTIRC
jgi:hypothetical protein